MSAPTILKAIPTQIINEQAAYGPFNLKDYINSSDNSPVNFSAEQSSGTALPKGLICTREGLLTGIPSKGTEGNYEFKITAENELGKVSAILVFVIKPNLSNTDAEYLDKIKSQVWTAVGQNLPIPDLGEMFDRDITPLEIYHLLERWGILTAWDAFNLSPPNDKVLITLEGASPHYHVYDRGSCLVASPKDIFSYERTPEDGLQTARAVAREIYKRQWTIELVGFDKLRRAAWVELQHLGDQFGRRAEVVNFNPTTDDVKLYTTEAIESRMGSNLE